jgi:lactoylglutathione lyase
LSELRKQVTAAEVAVLDQSNAACCYARSDKYWTTDRQGIPWETFHTLDSIPVYGDTVRAQTSACSGAAPSAETASSKSGACCT